MKQFCLVTSLLLADSLTSPAQATDFVSRLQAAKQASKSAQGAAYDASLSPYIKAAMQACIKQGLLAKGEQENFSLVANVSASGALQAAQVMPVSPLANCFAAQLGKTGLPRPPGAVGVDGYPVYAVLQLQS